ncbi:MAG: VacJ family lipoprotein [Syntrophobacteraceae bacterium]
MKVKRNTVGVVAVFVLLTFVLPIIGGMEVLNKPISLNDAAFAAEPSNNEDPFAVEAQVVADPLEPLNRVFFKFNDKLYFWFMKPLAKTYAAIVPEGLRIGIRNAFDNVLFPVRLVNNALQGKFAQAGGEVARFVINSTIGFVGMVDVANRDFGLPPHDEDLGQTFGHYGMKPVIYLDLPFLGPSSLRDSIGSIGDTALDPIFWATYNDLPAGAGVRVGKAMNNTSLMIGEYEDLKKSALDPYIALRDAYLQNRAKDVRN